MILTKSLIVAGAGLILQVGAGCFSPTIIEDDGDIVVLKYGPWESAHVLQGRADALCEIHGKYAEQISDVPVDLEPEFRLVTFDCLPSEPLQS